MFATGPRISPPARARRPSPETVIERLDAVLDGFGTASQGLLERRALLRRVDSKFLVPQSSLEPLLEMLRGDYAVLCAGAARLAEYRTLYFDTPDLRCFRDHQLGRRPRQKVRIRHYLDRRVSFLEVKTKHSDLVSVKHRRRKSYLEDELDDADRRFLACHSSLPVDRLRPEVWTDFRRITLIGLGDVERVTIDLDLAVRAGDIAETLEQLAIVEVKQRSLSARTPVMRALGASGKQPESASKYCIGVALTRGEIEGLDASLPARYLLELPR